MKLWAITNESKTKSTSTGKWCITMLDESNMSDMPESFWVKVTSIQYGKVCVNSNCGPLDSDSIVTWREGQYWTISEYLFHTHMSVANTVLDYPLARVLHSIINEGDLSDERIPQEIRVFGQMPHLVALSDKLCIWVSVGSALMNQTISTLRIHSCSYQNLTILQEMQNLKYLFINLPSALSITMILQTQPNLESLNVISEIRSDCKLLVRNIVYHKSITSIITHNQDEQLLVIDALKYRVFCNHHKSMVYDILDLIAEFIFGFNVDIFCKPSHNIRSKRRLSQ
jgi:hypothetical protein